MGRRNSQGGLTVTDQELFKCFKNGARDATERPFELRQSKMFIFARRVRCDLPWEWDDKPSEVINAIDRTWEPYREQLGAWFRKDFGDFWAHYFPEVENAREEFLVAWSQVRVPTRNVFEFVRRAELHFPLYPAKRWSDKYAQFVARAYHWQKLNRSDPFAIAQARWAADLKVSQRCLSQYCTWARQAGFLTQTAEARPGQQRAAYYRFHVERFDSDTGEEIVGEQC
jgi:hypothetical protein